MKVFHSILFAVLALFVTTCSWAAWDDPVEIVNPGFEDGAKGWTLPSNYSIDTTVSRTGKASLKITNTDPEVYQLANQDIKLQADTAYRFSVWVKTEGVQGSENGATTCIECWDKNGRYLFGSYPKGIKGTNDWTLVEGILRSKASDTHTVSLTVYLRKGITGTAWFDDVKVEAIPEKPMECAIIEPLYRGMITDGSPSQNITLHALVGRRVEGGLNAKDLRIKCTVTSAGANIAETSIRPVPGLNKIKLNTSKWPVGDYKLLVQALAPNGEELDRYTHDIKKIAANAPKPTVYVDDYGRTIKNGKPFFPFGFYFGTSPYITHPSSGGEYKKYIDHISDSPFNTIMHYNINSGSLALIREYLDYLDKKDVNIIYSIKDIMKGISYYQENLLGLGDEESQVRSIVTAFRDHPAVLAWYINDEAGIEHSERLKKRNYTVRELDPNHPTWSVLYQIADLPLYMETCDILGTDPYPINTSQITTVNTYARLTREAGGNKRCFWMVPQVFDWRCYKGDAGLRAPSMDEMIVMSYLSLIEGARGLIYYSYFDLQRDPLGFDVRWKDVKVMGDEVSQLLPAMLSLKKSVKIGVDCDRDNVMFTTKADDDGNSYLLLANVHKSRGSVVKITVPSGKKIELLKHAKRTDITNQVQNGKLTIVMPPTQAATVIVHK